MQNEQKMRKRRKREQKRLKKVQKQEKAVRFNEVRAKENKLLLLPLNQPRERDLRPKLEKL